MVHIEDRPIHDAYGPRASEVHGAQAADFAHGARTVGELLQNMSVPELGETLRCIDGQSKNHSKSRSLQYTVHNYKRPQPFEFVPYFSGLHSTLTELLNKPSPPVMAFIVSATYSNDNPSVESYSSDYLVGLRTVVSGRLDSILLDAISKTDPNAVMTALEAGANPAATTEAGPINGCKMSFLEVVSYTSDALASMPSIQDNRIRGTMARLSLIKELLMERLAAANGSGDSKRDAVQKSRETIKPQLKPSEGLASIGRSQAH